MFSSPKNHAKAIKVGIVPISLGQKYHEGQEFEETIQKINDLYDFAIIVVVDDLHRYTEMMKDGFSLKDLEGLGEEQVAQKLYEREQAARMKTRLEGDEWIKITLTKQQEKEHILLNKKKKPQGFLPGFTIPYKITRWNEWVTLPEYNETKQYIDKLYSNQELIGPSEATFQSLVDLVAEVFVHGFTSALRKENEKYKKGSKRIQFNMLEAGRFTIEYLKEELAFVAMLADGILPNLNAFFPDELVEAEKILEIAYPFGHNSTNKAVFDCFNVFCSEKLSLYNLSKKNNQKDLLAKRVVEKSPVTSVEGNSLIRTITTNEMNKRVSYLQANSEAEIIPPQSNILFSAPADEIAMATNPHLTKDSSVSGEVMIAETNKITCPSGNLSTLFVASEDPLISKNPSDHHNLIFS